MEKPLVSLELAANHHAVMLFTIQHEIVHGPSAAVTPAMRNNSGFANHKHKANRFKDFGATLLPAYLL